MNWEIGLAVLAASVSVIAAVAGIIMKRISERSETKHETEYVEVITKPIAPDTLSSVEADFLPTIKAALRRAGREQLLEKGEMQVEVERSFPTDEVIVALFTLASGIALETYKMVVLPALKERYTVFQKRRRWSESRNRLDSK